MEPERSLTISSIFVFLILLGCLTASCGLPTENTLHPQELALNATPGDFKWQTAPVIDNLRFEHLNLEDETLQNNIITIIQDRLGYLWFGTEDGLNQYDGRNFTSYKHDPDNPDSLINNWILALHEDQDGIIWIGTLNGGLDRYDPIMKKFTHFIHDPEKPDSLSHNEVISIFEDSDHNLWIGTRNGLDLYNEEGGNFKHYQHDPDNPNSLSDNVILSIAETLDGSLWVGTERGGLNRFDPKTETFYRYMHDPADSQSLIDNHVWVIIETASNKLWIGTNAGLDLFDPISGEFLHFQHDEADPNSLSHNTIQTIYEDPLGALWIGTNGGGLNRFDQESGSFARYQNVPEDPSSLSHRQVNIIYQDREGILWIGTRGGGVNKLFLGSMSFSTHSYNPNELNGLRNDDIGGIHEDQSGNIWVGTKAGLHRYNKSTGSWQSFEHDPDDPASLSSNNIGTVYVDKDGMVWVGTCENGLNRFDPKTGEFTYYPDGGSNGFSGSIVNEIIQDRQGIIWIGTLAGGLNKYDSQADRFTQLRHDPNDPNSISSDAVISLLEDTRGFLWAGTFTEGLNKIDRENDIITRYQMDSRNSESLSNNLITSIHEGQDGNLWIGTAGGLNKFDPQTETFVQFREKDGLPNDFVYGILEDDDGELWLSTNHGLSRFNPGTEVFRNFDIHDGLQANEFNSFAYFKSKEGEMYFGGINGLNAFYPEQIPDQNQYIPQIVLTSLTQGGEDLAVAQIPHSVQEITLKWPNNFFEFEFSALSFVDPDQNQYAYVLEGFESDWVYAGNQGIGRYTNLPGGDYTLRLFGSNHDEVWNETGHQIKINVISPFWQTPWFYAIATILIFGLAYGGYRFRVKSLEAIGRELEFQVEQRTSELIQTQAELKQREMEKAISEERNRLARDLHDSVTQSIYSLTLLSEAGQRMIQSGDLVQAKDIQTRLGEIAQQSLQEMRLLVYELRPQMLQREGLVGALEHRLASVERRAGINARLKVLQEIDLQTNFEEELFHISMEALNNVLKHAVASEVVVSLYIENDTLILEIGDNGRGFDPQLENRQGGIGISSMLERAEKIGGRLSIRSEIDGGTDLSVHVPLDRNQTAMKDVLEEKI